MNQAPPAQPILVPASEAAAARGMSRERLIRAIQRGEIPGVNRDGKWFVAAGESPDRSAA